MKKISMFVALVGLAFFICTGCATYMPAGAIYTGAQGAIGGSGDVGYSKVGRAMSTSILGLVATGDASIKTAAANGGIKRIKYVDYEVENVLGIYGKYTTVVYGD